MLAADQIDEGVAELRKIIATSSNDSNSIWAMKVEIARTGQLLDKKELLKEGIEGVEQDIATGPAQQLSVSSTVISFAELLMDIGRRPAGG